MCINKMFTARTVRKKLTKNGLEISSTKSKIGIILLSIIACIMLVNLTMSSYLVWKVQNTLSVSKYLYFKLVLTILFIPSAVLLISRKSYGSILMLIVAISFGLGLIIVNATPRNRRNDSSYKTVLQEFDEEVEILPEKDQKIWRIIKATDLILLSIILITLFITLLHTLSKTGFLWWSGPTLF